MLTIPCWASSGGNPVAASDEELLRSGSKQTLHTFTLHGFYNACAVFSAIFLFPSFHQSQDSRLMMSIVFYILFLVETYKVSCLWDSRFGIATTNSRCVVFWTNYGFIPLKNLLTLSSCLWSLIFLTLTSAWPALAWRKLN